MLNTMKGVNVVTKLLTKREVLEIKMKELRNKSEREKLKDCSFRPNIKHTKKAQESLLSQTISMRYAY